MQTILIVIHIIIAVLIIGSVLLQKSASDGLEGLSGGSGHDAIFSGKSTATFLSRTTAILFALFVINCIILANLSIREHKDDVVAKIEKQQKKDKSKNLVPIAE